MKNKKDKFSIELTNTRVFKEKGSWWTLKNNKIKAHLCKKGALEYAKQK